MKWFTRLYHAFTVLSLFPLCYIIYPNGLTAQTSRPVTYLGIEQGLSNNSVRCIYQDHNGFMWFGTYDGLNRYDGYECKVFSNKLNDSLSLPHNYIYTINEDRQHNLWVGTGQGIGIYNNLTAAFLPAYYMSYESGRRAKINMNVNTIKTDAGGNIFIGTNGWGLLMQPEGKAAAVQIPFLADQKVQTSYNAQSVVVDHRQQVWVFIADIGLCRYDYTAGKLRLVNSQVKNANCIEKDEKGNLWIGGIAGLHQFNIASGIITRTYSETAGHLLSANIASLFYDRRHCLWIGTEGGGLNILDPATDQVESFLPGEHKNNLSSESVYAIYEDKESRKWLGTLKGGINIIGSEPVFFQTVTHEPLQKNSLVNNFVSSFAEDQYKNLWIGTDGGGLSVWNRTENTYTNFRHDPGNPASLSGNLITSIKQDYNKEIWVATYDNGISKFNRRTNTFQRYPCINDKTGQENKNVWLLYEDKGHDLWAATFANGKLYRLNRRANRFEVFDDDLYDLNSIMEDRNGSFWAGNYRQLININRKGGKHVFVEIGKPVRAIFEDSKGGFWLGTEGGGLILFDRQTGTIAARYSDAEGLCNNAVLNILEDKKGHLWISTFKGLSLFNPSDRSFKNFYQSDGLQSNQFLYNAALQLASGELVFGGIKGFTFFNAANLQVRTYKPTVFITDLRVNNTPVKAGSSYIARTSRDLLQALRIPFNEAVLSFSFAALEYTTPGKICYAYYLEGWDKGWNYAGTTRTAHYTHLKEGNYILRIKSTDAGGAWTGDEITVAIVVLPPWYRSWWAYLLYTLLFMAAVYMIHRYKRARERLKYEIQVEKINAVNERERAEKERLIAEQQRQIVENQQQLAAKEREINEKRLSFFTNMAHEFRSPLTLIINPVQELLQQQEQGKGRENLTIIEHNSKRLIGLVNQLMLFRKAESEADKLNVTRFNLVALCKEVYFAFSHEAKAKKIDYVFGEEENLMIYADRERTEMILYNLISNAIKYTPGGKKILVAVSDTGEHVNVLVKDEGYGFSKETGEHIFEKFYRAEGNDISSKPGFGIGLYLVKNFASLQQATVACQSMPGEGSSFSVSFLKGAGHFREQDIIREEVAETQLQESVYSQQELTGKLEEPLVETLFITDKRVMLIADDDEEIRKYISRIFSDSFVCYEAANGEEAMEVAGQYVPDIIVCDVMMPGINGIECCNLVKSNPELAHIPFLLLTGTGSEEVQIKGAEVGADDYLTKPFSKELLLARVNALLKNRGQLQQHFYDEITQKLQGVKISPDDKAFLESCIEAMENRLNDDRFSIDILARDLGMSYSHLYKRVKTLTGYTINGFVRFIRLRKAARLFIDTNQNVNEVAAEVGLPDVKHFRESFNKQFGMNPSEFIKRYRSGFNRKFQIQKG
jgi:signal transduction histidine kinase/ligand-binding sensor domain-containing protein/DNA-binding response OmpR family regulator